MRWCLCINSLMTLRATSSILNVPMLCFTCIGEQTESLVGVGDLTVWIGLRAGRAASRLLGLNNSLMIIHNTDTFKLVRVRVLLPPPFYLYLSIRLFIVSYRIFYSLSLSLSLCVVPACVQSYRTSTSKSNNFIRIQWIKKTKQSCQITSIP